MTSARDQTIKSIVEGEKSANQISKAVKHAMNSVGDTDQSDEEIEKLCDDALSENVSLMKDVRRTDV